MRDDTGTRWMLKCNTNRFASEAIEVEVALGDGEWIDAHFYFHNCSNCATDISTAERIAFIKSEPRPMIFTSLRA